MIQLGQVNSQKFRANKCKPNNNNYIINNNKKTTKCYEDDQQMNPRISSIQKKKRNINGTTYINKSASY